MKTAVPKAASPREAASPRVQALIEQSRGTLSAALEIRDTIVRNARLDLEEAYSLGQRIREKMERLISQSEKETSEMEKDRQTTLSELHAVQEMRYELTQAVRAKVALKKRSQAQLGGSETQKREEQEMTKAIRLMRAGRKKIETDVCTLLQLKERIENGLDERKIKRLNKDKEFLRARSGMIENFEIKAPDMPERELANQ